MIVEKTIDKPKKGRFSKGGKNLVILGVLSALVAIITTSVSLIIYHNSGDIYLDRSRPGFLPDEEEIEENIEEKNDFNFEKSGKLIVQDIKEYLAGVEAEMKAIDAYEDPFGEKVLSDENLGILDENK